MSLPQSYVFSETPDAMTANEGPQRMVRGPTLSGLFIIVLFVSVFFGWGMLTPLAGGVIAFGAIAPDGSVRTVQHLEGGLVAEIFVREGDLFEAGTPLLALESVASQADVAALLDRRRSRLAEAARVDAEMAGDPEIKFPDVLAQEPSGDAAMAAEVRIFEARNTMRTMRRRVLGQRVQQLEEQIAGSEAQLVSAKDQLALVRQEVEDKSVLFAKGLTPKVDLLRIKRAEAEINGFEGEYTAAIARARQQIGETEIELLALDAEYMQELSLRSG